MPIYEYRCRECGGTTEIYQATLRMEEEPVCGHCRSSDLTKLITAPAAVTMGRPAAGATCCGRNERCDAPPCSSGEGCRRD